MNERPTPEEAARVAVWRTIVTHSPDVVTAAVFDALAAHGYRIVHPDDVPPVRLEDQHAIPSNHDAWIVGWNACRRHIFGGEQ